MPLGAKFLLARGEHVISEDGWLHEIPAPSESTMPIGKIFIKENDDANVISDKPKEQQIPPTEVLWAQILRSYSNCQLTFITDKIPALEGIASKFYPLIPHTYLFGHWLFHSCGLRQKRVALHSL